MVITERLAQLRRSMAQRGMDGYVVVTDDFHGSEYVGDYFKARAYLSGFTGSAGTLVVLPDRAALWTDGRYFLQAADQLAGSGIELMRMGQPNVPTIPAFLAEQLPEGGALGFDGRTVSSSFARTMEKALAAKHVRLTGEQGIWWTACGRIAPLCPTSLCGS
ncbi:MAG: aminopeptidase P family N-terminal domain-containing protein [Oscillospiraceae bacterium]